MKPFIAAVLLVFVTAPAWAQEDDALLRATEEDELARQLFERGEYEAAARGFQRAYEIYPLAKVKKSEIVAWFSAKDCASVQEQATNHAGELDTLEGSDKSDIAAMQTRCALQLAETALEEGDADEAAAQIEVASNNDVQNAKLAEITELRNGLAALRADQARSEGEETGPDIVEPIPPPARHGRKILGWSLIGLGLASASAIPMYGALYYTPRRSAYEDDNAHPESQDDIDENRANHEKLEKAHDTVQKVQLPLYIGGAVLAAAGTYFLLTSGNTESNTSLGVSGRGVEVRIRF